MRKVNGSDLTAMSPEAPEAAAVSVAMKESPLVANGRACWPVRSPDSWLVLLLEA
jgi:hypothetical protein